MEAGPRLKKNLHIRRSKCVRRTVGRSAELTAKLQMSFFSRLDFAYVDFYMSFNIDRKALYKNRATCKSLR